MQNVASNKDPDDKVYDRVSVSTATKASTKQSKYDEIEVGHPVGAEEEVAELQRSSCSDGTTKGDPLVIQANKDNVEVVALASSNIPNDSNIMYVNNGKRNGRGSASGTSNIDNTAVPTNCCSLAYSNIIRAICLLITAINFILGAIMMLPEVGRIDAYILVPEPLVFWLVGTLFFLPAVVINLMKRSSKDAAEILLDLIGLIGVLLWAVASFFLFKDLFDIKRWALLWILGSVLQLCVIAVDIFCFLQEETNSGFNICALMIAWIANILFVIGAGLAITGDADRWFSFEYSSYVDDTSGSLSVDLVHGGGGFAYVLVVGSVFYLFYAILSTVAMLFLPSDLTCINQISRRFQGAQIQTEKSDGDDGAKVAVGKDKPCSKIAMDVLAVVCILSSSMLFVIGASNFIDSENDIKRSCRFNFQEQLVSCSENYQDNRNSGSKQEPFLYWLVGASLFLVTSLVSILKRCAYGAQSVISGVMGFIGSLCWVVGSVFLIRDMYDFMVWGILWIVGSVFNLFKLSRDISIIQSYARKTKLLVICVSSGYAANVIILLSVVWMVVYEHEMRYEEGLNTFSNWDNLEFRIPVYGLISGTTMLSVYSFFYGYVHLFGECIDISEKNAVNEEGEEVAVGVPSSIDFKKDDSEKNNAVNEEEGEKVVVGVPSSIDCKKVVLDVLASLCFFSSSLFFTIGAFHFIDTENDIKRSCKFNNKNTYDCYGGSSCTGESKNLGGLEQEPFLYWLVGAMLFVAPSVYSIFKRCAYKNTKPACIEHAAFMGLAGSLFWVVGSVFLLREIYNFLLWAGLWIVGSILNLLKITSDAVWYKSKTVLIVVSVASGWIANALIFGSIIWMLLYEIEITDVENEDPFVGCIHKSWEDLRFRIPVCCLISGTMMMCIHSICYAFVQLTSIQEKAEDGYVDNEVVDRKEEEEQEDISVDRIEEVDDEEGDQEGGESLISMEENVEEDDVENQVDQKEEEEQEISVDRIEVDEEEGNQQQEEEGGKSSKSIQEKAEESDKGNGVDQEEKEEQVNSADCIEVDEEGRISC